MGIYCHYFGDGKEHYEEEYYVDCCNLSEMKDEDGRVLMRKFEGQGLYTAEETHLE